MGWKTNLIVIEGVVQDRHQLLKALGYDGASIQRQSTCETMFPSKGLVIGDYAGCTLVAEPRLPTKILDHPAGVEARRLLAQFPDRRILVCVLHSVVNLAGFSLFNKGELQRSFAVSSDDGIFINVGQGLSEEQQMLARYEQVTDDQGEVNYRDTDGEVYTLDQLGEEIVFEVVAGLTGKRPDFDDALFEATADVYRKHSWLASIFRR